ncbi:hypothetical protein MASR1M66_21380 [Aminivibrio sp.]
MTRCAHELVEVDKQAHKMIAAWLLFELNSLRACSEEKSALGEDIVRGGIFDYLYRLVITDIKPPIFYQIKANPAHYEKLTVWVLEGAPAQGPASGQGFLGGHADLSSARCAATRAWPRASSTRPTSSPAAGSSTSSAA